MWALVFGWSMLGTLAAIVFYHQKSLKMTSTTFAPVISAENREISGADRRRDETVVLAEFTACGQQWRVSHILAGKNADPFPPNSKPTVRYNPGDPAMSTVHRRWDVHSRSHGDD